MAKNQEIVETKREVSKAEQELLHTAWGAGESITTEDLIIPRVQLVQSGSDVCKAGKAREGEFIDSVTLELIGDPVKPLQVIVFHQYKNWKLYDLIPPERPGGNVKKKWRENQDFTPENADRAWYTDTEQADLTYNFYCLRTNGGDINAELPYLLGMSRSSRNAAKRLCTLFGRLSRINKPSAGLVIQLNAKREENEDGAWMSCDWVSVRDAEVFELVAAKAWYENITKGETKYKEAPAPEEEEIG